MRKNELICLGLIYSKPNYVYAIHQAIKDYKMDVWVNLSRSSIYNTLSKLVREENAELSIAKVGNMPDRKMYSITKKGRMKLHEEVSKIIVDVDSIVNLFYLSIGFLFEFDKDEAIKLLEIRKNKHMEKINDLKLAVLNAKAQSLFHAVIQCEAGIAHNKADIELVDKIIEIYMKHPDYFSEGLKRFYNDIMFNED